MIMKTKRLLLWAVAASFAVATASAAIPTPKGQWKFDDATDILKATVGAPLDTVTAGGGSYSVNGPFDGNLAIANPKWESLIMHHNLPASGGARVNQFTLQWDVMAPDLTNWLCLIQSKQNEGDGDLFFKPSTKQLGLTALNWSTNTVAPNTWYRIVMSVSIPTVKVYVDGQLWIEGKPQTADGRFSLSDDVRIFGDDDGEDDLMFCSELSLWDVALTDAEVAELGNATTPSFPSPVGLWQFDDANDLTKATVGQPLTLTGSQTAIAGPVEGNLATSVPLGSYLTIAHGINPNGGGAMVNEYSLQIDFSAPASGKWYSFFQTGDRGSDADLFVKASNATVGTSATTYTTNAIVANTWYRMLVTVKNGEFFRVYMDGTLWLEGTLQAVDDRWALGQILDIFQDNDGDDADINCSEIALWDKALTADQVLTLGDANKVTLAIRPVVADNGSDLGQNYPNPVKSATTFKYVVRKGGNVAFRVLDQTGKEVKKVNMGTQAPGQYTMTISAENLKWQFNRSSIGRIDRN
jgi:hypothetical protein